MGERKRVECRVPREKEQEYRVKSAEY